MTGRITSLWQRAKCTTPPLRENSGKLALNFSVLNRQLLEASLSSKFELNVLCSIYVCNDRMDGLTVLQSMVYVIDIYNPDFSRMIADNFIIWIHRRS